MPRQKRTITLNRYGWLAGLGMSVGDRTVSEIGDKFAETERALMTLRGSIVLNQSALRRVGRLDTEVSDFNKLRSQYAQQLTYFVGLIKGHLEALDEAQKDATFGVYGGTRAAAFDAELVKKAGSADPGLMLLKTLPVLRVSSGQLAGLGAPLSIAATALVIAGAAVVVAGSIKVAGSVFFSKLAELEAQAGREKQFIDAVQRCNNDQKCLDALKTIDPKAPPPGDSSTGVLIALGVGAALVILWPAISGRISAGASSLNSRYA